jgi:hypothetical protein
MMQRLAAALVAVLALAACSAQRVAKNVEQSVLFSTRARAAISICGKRSGVANDRADNRAHDRALFSCMRGYGIGNVVVKRPAAGGPPSIEARESL